MMRYALLAILLAGALTLGACRITPSVGVGYGIPGTPVGVGVGVPIPLGQKGKAGAEAIYRQLVIDSVPSGAELYINETLVGSTPMTASIPFDKGTWGKATGSAAVLVRKPGYLPAGAQLFPVDGGVATSPAGATIGRLELELRRER